MDVDTDLKTTDADAEEKQIREDLLYKPAADYSKDVEEKLPGWLKLGKSNKDKLKPAILEILTLEKRCRLAGDWRSGKPLAEAVIQLCFHHRDWNLLDDYLTALVKRHAQAKQVIQGIIQIAYTYVDQTPNPQIREELIKRLRELSEGRIYVELERARLTRMLAVTREKEGKKQAASDLMQEITVETVGSMELRERCEFILDQFRLVMDVNDWIRAELMAEKVNKKTLNREDFQDLKLRYYDLLIRYHKHKTSFLEISKDYHAVFKTPNVQEDEPKWQEALKSSIMYLCLAPFDHSQAEHLEILKADKKLENVAPGSVLATCKEMLKLLTTFELMAWPPNEGMVKYWQSDAIFSDGESAKARWESLRKRVIQHNIFVIAKYYSRITTPRLAALLSLSLEDSEKYLSELVSSKQVTAKIDRPNKTVNFQPKRSAVNVLNEWASDVSTLIAKVEHTAHLVENANMMHKIR